MPRAEGPVLPAGCDKQRTEDGFRGAPAADPDAVRDWFEFETIVDLPAPAVSFAKAEAAADGANCRRAAWADKMRRAYRAAVARFTEWCPVHPADRAAGVAADSCRLSGG